MSVQTIVFRISFSFLWIATLYFFRTSIVHAGLVASQEAQRSDGLCSTFVLPYKTYACQEFVAQTSDGFLIGVQRMWCPDIAPRDDDRQPVLLFHGILTGGDVWVLNPPDEALGFIMADAGYDVWIFSGQGGGLARADCETDGCGQGSVEPRHPRSTGSVDFKSALLKCAVAMASDDHRAQEELEKEPSPDPQQEIPDKELAPQLYASSVERVAALLRRITTNCALIPLDKYVQEEQAMAETL